MHRNAKQPVFPLDAALFTPAQVAAVSGLSRAMVDVWVSEERLEPWRCAPTQPRSKGRSRKGRGKPTFSSNAIFRVTLAVELRRHFGIGLSEWIPASKFDEVADRIAGGNWMWAVARGVENGKSFKIYTLATYHEGDWLFDMQLGEKFHKPNFGHNVEPDVPYLIIPTWKIYETVYSECKKLLGIVESNTTARGV